jgi:hypothetical protein
MLACMDQTKTQRTAPRLCRVQRVDDWRNLHEIGPRPCNQINPLHCLASISVDTPWMARWFGSSGLSGWSGLSGFLFI